MKHFLSLLLLGIFCISSFSQKPIKQNPSQIYESLQKLNFLGSVLYVAAHPDDENTRLISYFSNHVKARTAYLSMTRGDGGQNLIGPELRELLGVIRTQELLAARRVDGGEQFFTRANDFGYSKHPNETLEIWNKKEVLKDVVSIIRKFRPDIIVNRFNHRTPGTTHGHHTSSAMLSMEAFDLVNNESYESHFGDPWQPKRLFFNTSWWFYGSQEKFAKADKSNMINFDVGVYYPLKGLSNNEVAAIASSQHLCQGFGRLSQRGSQQEYIELLKGEMPDTKNPFEGIDTSWSRIEGGNAIGKILYDIEANFDFKNPAVHLPKLLEAYHLINKLEDDHWKKIKSNHIKELISSVVGLYLEASANASYINSGGEITINFEVLNRGKTSINLESIKFSNQKNSLAKNIFLEENKKKTFKEAILVSSKTQYTTPYWLQQPGTLGMYNVRDKNLIGKPETPRELLVDFNLSINGNIITISKPVVYRYSKPDKGELYKPFEILPPVSIKVDNKIIITKPKEAVEINVTIKALKDSLSGYIDFNLPPDWRSISSDKIKDVFIAKKGEQKTFSVLFKATNPSEINIIKPYFVVTNESYSNEVVEINYNHIPAQTVLMPTETKVVSLNIEKKGQRIAYIQGAGDKIPESLRQIGYTVIELEDEQITQKNLKNFDAIVLGIRAYNVNENAKFYQGILHQYVEDGGTLMVQYNTSRRQVVDEVAPYELKLSRDRVTQEDSEVTILDPKHEVINYPNKITDSDFAGWVQERGLYFPNKWSSEFTPLLAMNDKGESTKKGSLLVAKYGKGHFIYTGLSFFRELPAGVPGAFKLYANLLSIGKNHIEEPIKN